MNWQLSVPEPAVLVLPPAVSLDEAHSAIELWEHYSRKRLLSAQRLAVELMMAETSAGRWAARTTGRCEPRQNGKGDELEVVESWCLLQRGEWIVHTAHEVPTAVAAHRRLVDLLEGHRDLRRRVRQVRSSNADRSIEVDSGGIISYRTRTKGGGRGLDDISRIVVDEAQYAQSEQLAAAMPILAANPNPQTNFAGSGGIAGKSEWWWTVRRRALRSLAGEDEGEFAYLEHSAEKIELNRDGKMISTSPADVLDRGVQAKANPALGVWIEEEFLAEEYRNFPEQYPREHLCVWDAYPGDDEGFLPYDAWEQLAVEKPGVMRSVCYGLAVSDNAAVASAGRLSNGHLFVDTVQEEAGTDWVVGYLTGLYSRKRKPIHVDPSSAAGAFIRPLKEAGVQVVEVSSRQYQQACGEILDTIKNGAIRHPNQQSLNRAVRNAQRRDIGKSGGWVWAEPSTGVDLSTLKAATLALSGVQARRPPRIHTLEEGS